MVTFIDDYSRYVWVYFMKEKSEVFHKFKDFKGEAERDLKHSIMCLRSDNGDKYLTSDFADYLKKHKIKRQLTCANTPQQNGVSERKNRHLGEVSRSMMHDKNIPGRFWAEAMQTAAYVINRIPQQGLKYVSPYERLWNKKPNVSYFHVFGCVFYVFVPNHLRSKMEKKDVRCIFIGYDKERKGWRCCEPEIGRCYVSRNVVFDERSSWWSVNHETLPDTNVLKGELESSNINLILGDVQTVVVDDEPPTTRQQPWQSGVFQSTNADEQATEPSSLHRSTRLNRPNPKYANAAIVEDETVEPENFEQASVMEGWILAMNQEYDALMRNQTWELTPKPSDVKPISCKWVYKVKRKADGSVERLKARLVARGFSQEYGLDYEDTFSPVAKLTTMRVILALTSSKKWNLWQMDVSNAFLYGELDRVIYMDQPLGFVSGTNPNHVCKLKKALYGLKQSPRAWFGKIAEFLEYNGFVITSADASLFVKRKNSKMAVVLVYVDDLIITGDHTEMISQLKENLCIRFHMKGLGKLSHFLGLELSYESTGIVLHQKKYSFDLLKKFGMLNCKPTVTPIDTNVKLSLDVGRELEDPTMYRKIVGSLIYLTLTRPDLALTVGVLSRFMQKPRKPHLEAARRVLRYIKYTMSYGVMFKKDTSCRLQGYCDADYAGDVDTRRSTTGYVFMLGSNPIS